MLSDGGQLVAVVEGLVGGWHTAATCTPGFQRPTMTTMLGPRHSALR